MFFAVCGRRTEHITFENLCIITGSGETDLGGDLVEGEIVGVVFVDKSERIFQPLDLSSLRGSHDNIRIEDTLPVIDLIDQIS